ncbi:MAG: PDZ domain-containing protein, partial [Planctomycetes bacterium]|nr:PDZ domain-containing protein [Planctomycetota bacterium]
ATVFLPVATVRGQETPELRQVDVEKADQLRQDLRQMITLARDRVFPALINIRVITVRYWGGKEHKGAAGGSGTIISKDGHVLTNYHVVRNGRKFKCTLANKQEISAELVGEDPLTDLAVLKLNLSELKDPDMPLPVARFGDSDQLEIGDTVMAMGSPWALSRSVTLGIVSNIERILTGEDTEMRFDRDQRTGIFNRWIQHDAAINPGNSGGPLVNLKGELIGVNARGGSGGGGLGFAIPANLARVVARDLIEHGEVPRSWLGLSFKSIKKTGLEQGVLVNSVIKGAPAYRAGIRAGDVLTQMDGEPITVWFPEEVPPLLKRLGDVVIGSTIKFTYQRGDETGTADVVTERRKKDRGDEAAFRAWGLTAMEITEQMARVRRLDNQDGVLISSVASGSPAQTAEPAILPSDVIRSIDGEAIKSLGEFIKRYEAIMGQDELPEYLLVEFDRMGKSQVTLLKPKPDKDDDPPREVRKAWIGVAVQPVIKKLAKYLGDADALGYRITRVYPRTLAAESDLAVGDIILALNGEKLRPRGMQDAGMFQRQVRRLDIDESAKLTVLRGGERREVTIQLERTRIGRSEARSDRNTDFELTVRELTFFDRDDNRWGDDVRGVLVSGVERAGWAGLGGIAPRDLIQRIDEFEITKLSTYRKAMEAIAERKPERVVFVVLRGVRSFFQYVEPDWRPTRADGDDEEDKDEDENNENDKE